MGVEKVDGNKVVAAVFYTTPTLLRLGRRVGRGSPTTRPAPLLTSSSPRVRSGLPSKDMEGGKEGELVATGGLPKPPLHPSFSKEGAGYSYPFYSGYLRTRIKRVRQGAGEVDHPRQGVRLQPTIEDEQFRRQRAFDRAGEFTVQFEGLRDH